jgi:RNA polymerase sigma-70 factor (ECF subfamily)
MNERDHLATKFEEHRPHLRAVAYRMLGSVDDADDAVQETWLRLSRSDTSEVENLSGWLTTVVARVCLDMLRVRKSRREDSLEDRKPEPVVRVRGIAVLGDVTVKRRGPRGPKRTLKQHLGLE